MDKKDKRLEPKVSTSLYLGRSKNIDPVRVKKPENIASVHTPQLVMVLSAIVNEVLPKPLDCSERHGCHDKA